MNISVVLGTYNRAESLRMTLDSFSELNCPADMTWELVLVDNNSTDATARVVQTFASTANFTLRYVFEATQGRSAALNAGIRQAQGDIIVFTDDDVLLDEDWLIELKKTFDQHDCEAVAGRVVPLWNRPKPDWLEMSGQFAVVHFEKGEETKEIKEPPLGANSAFRKDVFVRHGGFRLDLGVRGKKHTITCDDTEFGERLIAAGEKIVYCPTAMIYHPVDPERITKKYFVSWYYYNGVSLTRTAGLPNDVVFFQGVPRWLFRHFGKQLFHWLVTANRILRFHRKLQACRTAGTIVESYRLSRAQHRDGNGRPSSEMPPVSTVRKTFAG